MTSYQKRKEDIARLLGIIDVLVGDNEYQAMQLKMMLRLERDNIKLAYFGHRQSESPFKTGGIFDQIFAQP